MLKFKAVREGILRYYEREKNHLASVEKYLRDKDLLIMRCRCAPRI